MKPDSIINQFEESCIAIKPIYWGVTYKIRGKEKVKAVRLKKAYSVIASKYFFKIKNKREERFPFHIINEVCNHGKLDIWDVLLKSEFKR